MGGWTDSAWWSAERRTVKENYPGAQFYRRINERGESVGVWMLTMEPAPLQPDASIIYEDLDLGNPVSIGTDGKIWHSENCQFAHDRTRQKWSSIHICQRRIRVELEYPANLVGLVGPIHPRFRVLSHGIIGQLHPHLFQWKGGDDRWACPVAPHGTDWNWDDGGTLGYLDQCALWLLKTELWNATGGDSFPSLASWIGPDAGHQPAEVMSEAKENGPCRCGSGNEYRRCCMVADKALLMAGPSIVPPITLGI